MKILVEKPPVYDACVAKFGAALIVGRPIVWAYGDAIYNPMNIGLPRDIIAHEKVHLERQGGDPAAWWKMYLKDDSFRYDEELAASRVEWRTYQRWHPGKNNAAALEHIAAKLSSELYGGLVTPDEALRAIVGAR